MSKQEVDLMCFCSKNNIPFCTEEFSWQPYIVPREYVWLPDNYSIPNNFIIIEEILGKTVKIIAKEVGFAKKRQRFWAKKSNGEVILFSKNAKMLEERKRLFSQQEMLNNLKKWLKTNNLGYNIEKIDGDNYITFQWEGYEKQILI